MMVHTHWFPNSEAVNRKPVFRTHMDADIGTVSKYFMRSSVTYRQVGTFKLQP